MIVADNESAVEIRKLETNEEEGGGERVDIEDLRVATSSRERRFLPTGIPLQCDALWNTAVTLCWVESVVFVLKVTLLPVQIYIMIGGPLLLLFIWPLWATFNSIVLGGVVWARDPETDPCLSAWRQWVKADNGHEHPRICRDNTTYEETKRNEEEEGEVGAPACVVSAHPWLCDLSPVLWSGVVIGWSAVDILLTILTAVGSFLLVFVTYSDADGAVAEGWDEGYVLMWLSGLAGVVSLGLRVAIIVYCIRYRYRAATRKNQQAEAEQEGHSTNEAAIAGAMTVVAPHKALSLRRNQLRLSVFLFSVACFLVGVGFCSVALHDFLRSGYYLPNSIDISPHGDTTDERCDLMDPVICLLPFPSSHYTLPSASTATGRVIDISDNMLPLLKRGMRYDSSSSRLHDGFSVSGMLLWYLSPHVLPQQLTSFKNITTSLIVNATTLLINSNTLELHPHFSEKDHLDPDADRLSTIVPARALDFNTTYIAVVKGLTDSSGQQLPPSNLLHQYIQAYHSNSSSSNNNNGSSNNNSSSSREWGARDNERYAYFSSVAFPLLHNMGIDLRGVQLLWDFHTASQESLTHILTPVYNSTTALVQQKIRKKEKLYTKTSSTSEKCTGTVYSTRMWSDHYTLSVPWYLHDHSRVINPVEGERVYPSERDEIPFSRSAKLLLQIPCSVREGLMPATTLMEIGHGLFWDRSFAEMSHITEQANQHGWVLWSMDWRGLTRHDLPQFLRLLLYDMSRTGNSTVSAMAQGMSDKLAGYLILQVILEEEYKDMLKHGDFFLSVNQSSSSSAEASSSASSSAISSASSSTNYSFIPKELLYSGSTIAAPNMYLGISLGAIMGAAWNAYAPIHLRSTLMAGGAHFAVILGRSDIFGLLKGFTDLQFYSRMDLRIGVQLMQWHLDCFEASAWQTGTRPQNSAEDSSDGLKPTTLLQTGLGDSTVSDISGRILAANLNASLLSPAVYPYSTLPRVQAPVSAARGNVLFQVLYRGDASEIPDSSESTSPCKGTQVHKCIIQRAEITSQYATYFMENKVIQPTCEQPAGDPGAACVFDGHVSCVF